MIDRMNIVVWGLGQHAFKNVLPAIRNAPDVRLAGVYSRSPEAVDKACRQYGCASWPSPAEMLAEGSVDAVYLATPTGLHHEHGLTVLQAGKHLLCEKSLTHDRETSIELIKTASEKRKLLAETFMYLYHPQFLFLRQLVAENAFGQVHTIQSNFYLPELPDPGFRFNAELGGSALLDTGCYPVSAVLGLFPGRELPQVKYAMLRRDRGFEVDTVGAALFEFADGLSAWLNWGYGRAYRNELKIIGSEKAVHVNRVFTKRADEVSRVEVFERFGKSEIVEFPPADSFVRMFAHVREGIANEEIRGELLSQIDRQSEMMRRITERAGTLD